MILKFFPYLSLGLGVFVLVQVAMPYLAFKSWELLYFNNESLLVDPTPKRGLVLGVAIENVGNFPAIVSKDKKRENLAYTEFFVTVKTAGLDRVRVVVESSDFEENLAHLPGTALPGEKGNVFITGHSSLTAFFRPGNFKAIFANLPKVKKGEEIVVEAGGQKFIYIVEGLKIVAPEDVEVVKAPEGNGRYITLMTCVPPGFNTKRLVVLGKLQ